MTKDPNDDNRFVYGPRPVGALLPRITRPAFRKRAPAGAQVLADWEAIVGPAIAAVTVPRRLSSGTLAIACSGPIALELQHMADALAGRINAHLGHTVVQRLRFVQEAAPAPARPRPRQISAADAARIERTVADLPEGKLRQALAGLGRAVLTRRDD
jgi:hypothetical protein